MLECYYCGHKAVGWESDSDFSECGYQGQGTVRNYHCRFCGATIEVAIPLKQEDPEI